MQHNSTMGKIIGKFWFFLTFSLCILLIFSSCASLPEQKKDEKTDIVVKEPVTKKSLPATPKEKVTDTTSKKKMNKVEFGLAVQSHLNKGEYDASIEMFNKTEEVEESVLQDVSTKVLKLSIMLSAGKATEAKQYANALEASHPDNLELLYSRVMLAQQEKNEKERKEYLKKILTKYPHDSWALTAEGMDFFTKKNYSAARKKFLLALKYSPKSVDALLGLASLNYMENKLKEAENNLNVALEIQEDDARLWAQLARVNSESNKMLEAVKNVKKAIELEGNVASHWTDLGLYYMQMGKRRDARTAFSKVIELDPSSYMAFIYRAGINDELEYYKEALEDYYKVISLYPSYYFAFEGAGILHIMQKEWDKAEWCFKNALKNAPSHYNYAILASFCMQKAGNGKEAKDFIREFTKKMDKNKDENEYLLTRLFYEHSGDTDVNNRVMKLKDRTKRYQMMFYLGAFYEMLNKKTIAEKYYIDVLSAKVPSFIEYKLAKLSLNRVK